MRLLLHPEQFPYYEHEFADDSRMPVQARLYSIQYLPAFRRYFNEEWLPQQARDYLSRAGP